MRDAFTFDEETHTYTVDGVVVPSVTQICEPITAGKYPPSGVVEQAARRGSRIHELCALYDMDALPDEFEGDLLPYVQAWANFCRDYSPEWLYIEKPMYCGITIKAADHYEERIVAGTLDRLGVVGGKTVVVDIKTAQSLDRPAKIALACQLAAYAELARRSALLPPFVRQDHFGVQLLKTGTYRIYSLKSIEGRYGFDARMLFTLLLQLRTITKGE